MFKLKGKAVNSLVPVGPAALDVDVDIVEVLNVLDVDDEAIAGHDLLPPATYPYTSL